MITESEAKMKVCPKMTYCVNEANVTQDGHSAIYYQANCHGSACMAWRWANALSRSNGGYCGAFGEPSN